MEDVVNLPVQMKGQMRQFIRIKRGIRAEPGGTVDLKVVDATGVPIRGLSARVTAGSFDGLTSVRDVKVSFDKPAGGAESLGLMLMGKRPALVEMPFTLKDVPLP